MQRTAPHGAPSSFLLYPRQAANCARTPAISIVAGFARLAAGLLYPRQGRLEALLLKGPRQPHRNRQIERTDKDAVHTLHRCDILNIR